MYPIYPHLKLGPYIGNLVSWGAWKLNGYPINVNDAMETYNVEQPNKIGQNPNFPCNTF